MRGAAIGTIKVLFSLILVIVISVYMLLDMPRLGARIDGGDRGEGSQQSAQRRAIGRVVIDDEDAGLHRGAGCPPRRAISRRSPVTISSLSRVRFGSLA